MFIMPLLHKMRHKVTNKKLQRGTRGAFYLIKSVNFYLKWALRCFSSRRRPLRKSGADMGLLPAG